MTSNLASRAIAMAILSIGLFVLQTGGAAAHGIGKPQLLNAPSGPYLISVWTDPDPLRADETHVIVGVSDPVTRRPIVTDVVVQVVFQSAADPSITHRLTAGNDDTNRLLFAAEFNNRVTPGQWRVDIIPSGSLGEGQPISFDVNIEPARGFNWLWIGLGLLAALIAVWMATSLRAGSAQETRRPARNMRRPEAGTKSGI